MAHAVAAGRIPPYTISANMALVSLAEEAKRRGHPNPFFEHPLDRQMRLHRSDLITTLIFQPGGRVFTKRVLSSGPVASLMSWQVVQKNSKLKTFQSKGPWLDYLVYAANMRIGTDRDNERNVPVRSIEAVVKFCREDFMNHGVAEVHLKPQKKGPDGRPLSKAERLPRSVPVVMDRESTSSIFDSMRPLRTPGSEPDALTDNEHRPHV